MIISKDPATVLVIKNKEEKNMWLLDFLTDKIGVGWFILGILAGLVTFGLIGGTFDAVGAGLIVGVIVLIGIWVIGGVRMSRYY